MGEGKERKGGTTRMRGRVRPLWCWSRLAKVSRERSDGLSRVEVAALVSVLVLPPALLFQRSRCRTVPGTVSCAVYCCIYILQYLLLSFIWLIPLAVIYMISFVSIPPCMYWLLFDTVIHNDALVPNQSSLVDRRPQSD